MTTKANQIFQSINPYNNEVIQEYTSMESSDLDKAVFQAGFAYQHWRKTSMSYRADLFENLANALRNRKEECAKMMTLEMGKVYSESISEVEKCAWVCEYYAKKGAEFLQPLSVSSDGRKSYVRFDPLGCVLGIMPWNFPLWQVFRYAVPTLMAGNVTMLKHASNVFGCAQLIDSLFQEAGLPKGVFQNLIIGSDAVPYLMQQPIIQAATLTGSERAGVAVAQLAGENLKKMVLELGGSDAFIVLKDADIKKSAHIGAQSRLLNTGQSCIAAKRFIVESGVMEEFKELVIKEVQGKKLGDPMKEETDLGPMARTDLAEELYQQTKQSIIYGAKVELEGGQDKAHFAPYVLSKVKSGMPAFDEEMFGPVISLIEATDEQEAIKLANDSPYGLGASLWTEDLDKATVLAKDIEAGGVFINALVKSDPRLPFGGIKRSGYGRELSSFGIREFVNAKTVYVG